MTGKLISTKFIIGNIVQLRTRALYKVTEKRLSWDKKFNIGNYNDTVEEIFFGSLTYATLTMKRLENIKSHLYLFTQMQVTMD